MKEHNLKQEMTSYENRTIFTAAVVGFFYLLRVSEIANLHEEDITIEETPRGKRLIIIIIRKSKTDQSGAGISRALLGNKGPICPVEVLEKFLELRGWKKGGTYLWQNVTIETGGSTEICSLGQWGESRGSGAPFLESGWGHRIIRERSINHTNPTFWQMEIVILFKIFMV